MLELLTRGPAYFYVVTRLFHHPPEHTEENDTQIR